MCRADSLSRHLKSDDSHRILNPNQFPALPQVVKMCQRLAHRESHLVCVKRALEKNRKNVCSTECPQLSGSQYLCQSFPVVFLKLCNAGRQPHERLAMRRQHARINGQVHILEQRRQKQLQGVRLRFADMHADVGGDAWQNHIATDQCLGTRAVERDVLGCMAIPADTSPCAATDVYQISIHETTETGRQCRHQA